jgi:hypothetical protein
MRLGYIGGQPGIRVAMAKNILIFADGTGNEGGLLPDESRTNVYKLFCATRTGPDSPIDPAKQIAFYIPGVMPSRLPSAFLRCSPIKSSAEWTIRQPTTEFIGSAIV